MDSTAASLNAPDKFGLIVQCRQSMDEIPASELKLFAKATMDRFSTDQLKAFLFTGLYAIVKDMDYHQVFAINSGMSEIVQKLKKKQQNKTDNKDDVPATPLPLTEAIHHQVLSNVVCPFLMMADITQLAKVSRVMCIIAHTPASISNLCIRHDPYRYAMDGRNYDYHIDGVFAFSGLYRFRNARQLAISSAIDIDWVQNERRLTFAVEHLTLHSNPFNELRASEFPILPSLKTITFECCTFFWEILPFLDRYEDDERNIIHRLESIAFVNCPSDEEQEIDPSKVSNWILPSQPNKLKVLKFESSELIPSDDPDIIDEWNRQLRDLDKIKTSLANLEGFVFVAGCGDDSDQFYLLSLRILQNSHLFTRLRSLHVHDPSMIINDLLLPSNNIFSMQSIDEFCVTLSPELLGTNDICFFGSIERICSTAKKCCLVLCIRDNLDNTALLKFSALCFDILRQSTTLNLFQVDLIIGDETDGGNGEECYQKVIHFCRHLIDCLRNVPVSYGHVARVLAARPLVFKMLIKNTHNTLIMKKEFRAVVIDLLIMNYFLHFPKGIIQIKFSDNRGLFHCGIEWDLSSLQRLFDIDIKFKHSFAGRDWTACKDAHDYAYLALSASVKRGEADDMKYDKRWNVDCQFCCNTPWI